MAKTKTKQRAKSNPSPAQLRARRNFTRMAKQRAKDARAKKRNAAKRSPARRSPARRSVRNARGGKAAGTLLSSRKANKPGPRARRSNSQSSALTQRYQSLERQLHQANQTPGQKSRIRLEMSSINRRLSQMSRRNADHKDPSHQVEVRHHYRAGGASAWKRAEQQGQQRLFKMNAAKRGRGGRRRNSASEADQLHETFLGRPTDEVITMRTPAGTPKHITGLGQLLKIHTDKQTLIFDERDGYTLCADPSEGLHIGSRCDERFEALADLGEIRRITYAATKNHLDNRPVEYFHDTEPTRPRLTTDKDGLLLIEGGDYSISAAGIEG